MCRWCQYFLQKNEETKNTQKTPPPNTKQTEKKVHTEIGFLIVMVTFSGKGYSQALRGGCVAPGDEGIKHAV